MRTYVPAPAPPPAPRPTTAPVAPLSAPDWSRALAPPQPQPAPPVKRRSRFDWYARLEEVLAVVVFGGAIIALVAVLLGAADICGVTRAGAGATLVPRPGLYGGPPLREGQWLLRSCVEPQQNELGRWTPVYRSWPEGSGWMLERGQEPVTP